MISLKYCQQLEGGRHIISIINNVRIISFASTKATLVAIELTPDQLHFDLALTNSKSFILGCIILIMNIQKRNCKKFMSVVWSWLGYYISMTPRVSKMQYILSRHAFPLRDLYVCAMFLLAKVNELYWKVSCIDHDPRIQFKFRALWLSNEQNPLWIRIFQTIS